MVFKCDLCNSTATSGLIISSGNDLCVICAKDITRIMLKCQIHEVKDNG